MRGNLREQLRRQMRQVLDLDDGPVKETPRWATGDLLEQQLAARPGLCRLCDSGAQVQLLPTIRPAGSDHTVEYLCYDHVGEFAKTWADPRVLEWTVVRL